MKRKIMNQAMAVILSAATVMSMTGCGGSNTANTSGSSGNTESVSSSGAPTDHKEKPVLTFMAVALYGSELKNEYSQDVIKSYEEYTGYQIDWRWEANDTYKEKLGLTLMDKGNMPMILTCGGSIQGNIVDAAKRGAFWDLTEYLKDESRFPNLSKGNENVNKALTIDGKLIGVYRSRAIGRFGMSYRTDWAEAVGITKAPETIAEMYDMLYKFTYEDPDGNGKDDTYGLEMTKYTGPLDIMQTWFGAGNEWVEQNGKLIPVHQTAEYMEALQWMRKIYTEGLIRQDWASVDSASFGDACKKGEAGVFVDVVGSGARIWDYYTDNDVKSVVDPSQLATMNIVGPVNGKTLATNGYNGFFVITKDGAKTEEDLINCLTFLDKMCDDEMMILADYGLDGISYNLDENGEVVLNKDMKTDKSPQCGLNQSVAYIPNRVATSPLLVSSESNTATTLSYDRNEAVAVFNPAIGYLANSSVNAEVGTDIKQIIDDARTQFICNQIDEAGFESAAKQWLDRGGDRLIEEVNELYEIDLGAK